MDRDIVAFLVPFRLLEYRSRGGITESDLDRIASYSEMNDAYRDDILIAPDEHKKALATQAGRDLRGRKMAEWIDAIAVLSYSVGGIKIFGQQFISSMSDNPLDPENINATLVKG